MRFSTRCSAPSTGCLIFGAQRDGNYRPVQLLNQLFILLENTVSIASFFTLLLMFKWYFLFLILLAVVPRTWVQFRYANRKYSMINSRTPEQRKVNYFSYLLSNNIFAKEIKLFSLGGFFLDKYRTALDKFYSENRNLAEKRTRANVLTGILAAISSYGAYGIIIYDTVLGSITIGSMTMYYQAFSRSQSSLDTFLKTIAGLYENMLYVRNYLEFMDVEGKIEEMRHPAGRDTQAQRQKGEDGDGPKKFDEDENSGRRGAIYCARARPSSVDNTNEKTNPTAHRESKTLNFLASGGAGAACCAPIGNKTIPCLRFSDQRPALGTQHCSVH